jgi:enoyl-CoA hydratase
VTVRVTRSGPITTVLLDRPESRNAIDRDTATALADAFRAFDADPQSRVAVLAGAGGHFCSGADLKALAAGRGNRVEEDGDGPLGPTRLVLGKPVIAAVAGYAVAGGLELALWCDLRVVEESAVLGVFCRRFGVPLVDGGTARLPRLIGLSRALDLILTGRPVSATEALAIGLAHRLVPDGRSRTEATALAERLAAFPQECLRSDRRAIYEGAHLPLAEALVNELRRGRETIRVTGLADVARFAEGEGRGGEGT